MSSENERTRQYEALYEESLALIDEWQAAEREPTHGEADERPVHEAYYHEESTTINQTIISVGIGGSGGAIRLRMIGVLIVLALAGIAIITLYQAVMALLPLLIAILHIVFVVLAILFLLAALGAVALGVLHILPSLLTLWERVCAWRACRHVSASPHEITHFRER